MNHGIAIKTKILADTSITSIIGARLYPLRVPELSPFPCLTYQTVSNVPYNSKTNFKGYKARVQINVFTNTYKSCVDLSKLIVDCLADVKSETIGTLFVHSIRLENTNDQEEDFANGDGLVHNILEFFIDYNR